MVDHRKEVWLAEVVADLKQWEHRTDEQASGPYLSAVLHPEGGVEAELPALRDRYMPRSKESDLMVLLEEATDALFAAVADALPKFLRQRCLGHLHPRQPSCLSAPAP